MSRGDPQIRVKKHVAKKLKARAKASSRTVPEEAHLVIQRGLRCK